MVNAADVIDLFVPGRLCLFGEHSDWAGTYRQFNASVQPGMALVTGVDLGIYAHASRNDRLVVRTVDHSFSDTVFDEPMEIGRLKEIAREGGYFSYIAGVATYVKEHYNVGGVYIDIYDITLPVKKGLSSSAAICVLTARAFNILYDLHMNLRGEMQVAYRGELLTPSRCGRMDQACAYGSQPVCLTFDGDRIDVNTMKIGGTFHWVFADLMAEKDTMKILSDLNKCYPYPTSDIERNVHLALGENNLDIVREASRAIESGDAALLGALMDKAQAVFDEKVAPACPQELTAPKLHQVMNDPIVRKWVYGSKGIGSQGDGTVQFIAKDEQAQAALVDYLSQTLGLYALPFTIQPKVDIKKAIVPIAGLGTRMYPATLAIHKALLPVVDKDGLTKPALYILLEELVDAGIEEICLVIGPDDADVYTRILSSEIDERIYRSLSEIAKSYENKRSEMVKRVRLVTQDDRLGFGHAVWLGKDFAGNDPVLVVLGDHLFDSFITSSCTEQLISMYKRAKMTTIAIEESAIEDVVQYGTVYGSWYSEDMHSMSVSAIAEKPTIDYAAENLFVMTTAGVRKYYVIFGLYIITPAVFDSLEHAFLSRCDDSAEIQLTDALNQVIASEGITAMVPEGKRYDTGIPRAYRQTVSEFRRGMA